MSSVSATSSRREKNIEALRQELEAVKTLNATLNDHLTCLRTFKKSIIAMNDNFDNLQKLNEDWVLLLEIAKQSEMQK